MWISNYQLTMCLQRNQIQADDNYLVCLILHICSVMCTHVQYVIHTFAVCRVIQHMCTHVNVTMHIVCRIRARPHASSLILNNFAHILCAYVRLMCRTHAHLMCKAHFPKTRCTHFIKNLIISQPHQLTRTLIIKGKQIWNLSLFLCCQDVASWTVQNQPIIIIHQEY